LRHSVAVLSYINTVYQHELRNKQEGRAVAGNHRAMQALVQKACA